MACFASTATVSVEWQRRSNSLVGPFSVNYCGLIFMPSEAESALLDASICLHALALRGVVRSVMLLLADVRACEWRCGCLCFPAQCFCVERFAYNPNHSSLMPSCLRCLFIVPV